MRDLKTYFEIYDLKDPLSGDMVQVTISIDRRGTEEGWGSFVVIKATPSCEAEWLQEVLYEKLTPNWWTRALMPLILDGPLAVVSGGTQPATNQLLFRIRGNLNLV